MARINNLNNFLTDVASAIKEKKGDNTPILASEFDTEIENLPTGEKIETLAKLNEKANELVEYYKTIPSTYTSYTDENITLYTPDETCKTYAIAKRTNGMYRIFWFKNNIGINFQKISSTSYNLRAWYLIFGQTTNYDLSLYSNKIMVGLFNSTGYQSSDMSTLNQCLTAIQSNSTTYSNISGLPYIAKDTNYDIPFCNTFIIDSELNTPATTQKISSNETIQVKS